MERKEKIDALGVSALIGFSIVLAFNQVVIKVTNDGFQPVFFAAIRSIGGAVLVGLWLWYRGIKFDFSPKVLTAGIWMGTIFAVEFIFMFVGLDLTTVSRSTVIFYAMPVWLAIAAHFILPGEKMSLRKAVGLGLSFAGVVVVLFGRGEGSGGSLTGDLCALAGSMAWAGIALMARGSALKDVRPELQSFYQVAFSIPLLVIASFFFGPFIRNVEPIHIYGLIFQTVIIVSAGYMFWLWLLTIYPASGVASFSFLTPIFGVFLGWWLLDEVVGFEIWLALALVALGLWLVNRPSRPAEGL
jgi:drug/metabolite transporter (DMT)-like permease